jgi:two-component system sensor histidine kinase/response regulator
MIRLRFEVLDTGLGMSELQSSRLFMPFSQGDESTTRKFGGTGLGLSISKGMVNLMRGEISLQSELGRGTNVSFEIPFHRIENVPMEANYDLFDQFNVLVVDDHLHAAKLLSSKLANFGVRSILVNSGEEALSALTEAEEQHRQFDAIFVDLHMPYMDGAELISQIRRASFRMLPKIALVGATAREGLNYREEATITDAYLDKPFNSSNVFDCLVNMFSYHRHFNSASSMQGTFKCKNLHVLLVEDNLVNQQIATELLEAAEIVVDVAANGRCAVDRLFDVGANYYGLVLMDVQMPELDGHEATKLIRQNPLFQELPIIAMTAHALLMEREKCFESGMNAHITKPINPSELYQTVADWCSSYVIPNSDHRIVNNSLCVDKTLHIPGVDTRLGLSRTMGDKQLYLKLLKLFVFDQATSIHQIREALMQSDYKTAERVAHTLKGVAGLIGADVQLLAARIESQIEGLIPIAQIANLLDSAEKQLNATVEAIESCLKNEYVLTDLSPGVGEGKILTTEEIHQKLRACYQLVLNYDSEALELLNDAGEELNLAFGSDVQKQIMRAASQYDFDVIQSIMKGNAHMIGMSLE